VPWDADSLFSTLLQQLRAQLFCHPLTYIVTYILFVQYFRTGMHQCGYG
jgi:hypothetical protein